MLFVFVGQDLWPLSQYKGGQTNEWQLHDSFVITEKLIVELSEKKAFSSTKADVFSLLMVLDFEIMNKLFALDKFKYHTPKI